MYRVEVETFREWSLETDIEVSEYVLPTVAQMRFEREVKNAFDNVDVYAVTLYLRVAPSTEKICREITFDDRKHARQE